MMSAKHYGCRVIAITVSNAQFNHATAGSRDAGLEDRIGVRLQDCRDVEGVYDRIVAIGMFEAIGEENWSTFFDVIRRRLKPG